MTIHDEFREWDGAYVLGSLAPAERMRYERHMGECARCREAVAELAGMPGLLSKVPAAEAETSLMQDDAVEVDLLPRLVHRVARRRWRNRALVTGGVLAALVAAFVWGPLIVPQSTMPSQTASDVLHLEPVAPTSMSVTVRMGDQEWGTRIDLECSYGDEESYGSASDYALFVTDANGGETEVVTWAASPGQTAWPSGTTSLSAADIRVVEVREISSGQVLLRGSP